MIRFLLIILAALFADTLLYAKVVVTTKPLYFIVAPLLQGVDTPILLKKHNGCSHQNHLRPSEVSSLKSAKLVFSSGAERHVLSKKNISNVIFVSVFSAEDGIEWLSPKKVRESISDIVGALKTIYPLQYHDILDQNANSFSLDLNQLDVWVREHMLGLKLRAVITTYAFFKYFADDYNLEVLNVLTPSPLDAAKPRSLKKTYALLNSGRILGIVKDHHMPIDVLKRVFSEQDIKVLEIDIEAVKQPITHDGYHILIENMVRSIVRWAQ